MIGPGGLSPRSPLPPCPCTSLVPGMVEKRRRWSPLLGCSWWVGSGPAVSPEASPLHPGDSPLPSSALALSGLPNADPGLCRIPLSRVEESLGNRRWRAAQCPGVPSASQRWLAGNPG